VDASALASLGEQVILGTERNQVLVVMYIQFAHGGCFLRADGFDAAI
jgi:hypothetical protein